MPAAAAATKAAPSMMFGGENHEAVVEIKITGPNLRRRAGILGTVKFHDARAADAAFIFQFRGHAREQRFGDFHLRAPAPAFVSGGRTKLAIVRRAAERAAGRIKCRWRIHAGICPRDRMSFFRSCSK